MKLEESKAGKRKEIVIKKTEKPRFVQASRGWLKTHPILIIIHYVLLYFDDSVFLKYVNNQVGRRLSFRF